ESFVNHGGLREIRNFCRASDVGQRRKQVILQYRAKQHVGVEILRGLRDAPQQFFSGQDVAAYLELPVGAVHHQAGTIHDRKHEGGFRSDLDLLVVSGGLQFAIALQDGVVQFRCVAHRVGKQRSGDSMKLCVRRVENDKSVYAEDAGEQLGKRVRERFALGVALAQVIGGERFSQQLGSLRDGRIASLSEADGCDRSTLDATGWCRERRELKIIRQQQRLIDFRQ